MPEKNTQNSIVASNFLGVEKNGKPNLKISQEKAYQILSEGLVFTMEGDLKEAMSQQRMKADLIPGQARPIGKPEKFQPEKPYFDPFKNLGQPAEVIPEKELPPQSIEKPAPAPVSMARGPAEPLVAPSLIIEEKPLPFRKVDVLDKAKQVQEERLVEEKFSQITPEQETVQKALAEKAKIEEQKKEKEAIEVIRQEARKQEEKEKKEAAPKVPQVSRFQPKGLEGSSREAEGLEGNRGTVQPSPPRTTSTGAGTRSPGLAPSPILTGKDWLKGIPFQSLPKIKQELSQKTLDILAQLKKLSLEERPFSEKHTRLLVKLKEKNLILNKALAQVETAKERQRQIEDLEAKAQSASQKHTLEQKRWEIEETLKQTEEAKWAQEEEVEKFHLALSGIDSSLNEFKRKQNALENKKSQIQKFLAGLDFFKEKEILNEKIKASRKQIQALETQQRMLLGQQKELDIQINDAKQQEQRIEERAKTIEKQVQQTAEFRERRKLEQERWQVAEQRRIQEKRRWELEKENEVLLPKLQAIESRLHQERRNENDILKKVQEIETQIGEIPLLQELSSVSSELAKFWEKSGVEEITKPAVSQENIAKASAVLIERVAPEKEVRAEPKTELSKPSPALPQAQTATPEKRTEEEILFLKKTQTPTKQLPISVLKQNSPEEQEVIEQIRLQAKAKEQELALAGVKQQIEQEKRGITAEMRQKQEEEARQKSIQAIKKLAEQEQKKAFFGKLKGPLLKEEVLRKISKIYPQEEAQRQEFLEKISQKTKPQVKQKAKGLEEGVVFHPMIRKTSLFEKVAVRVLIVILMVGIGFGLYLGVSALIKHNKNKLVLPSYQATSTFISTSTEPFEWPVVVPGGATTTGSTSSTSSSQASSSQVIATSTVPQATTTIPATPPPAVQAPSPIIPVSKTFILSFQIGDSAFFASTSQVLQSPAKSGSFEQIAVKDEQNNNFLTVSQISEIMQVEFPQELAQKDVTSTLLVFGSKYGNRLGFIVQTESTSTLFNSFKSWESQAESQTEPIFSLMGKTSPALNKVFKLLKYKTVSMWCQTFTKQDLGICYAVYKNYFIFTSSFEQMARIVDKLP